MDYTIYYGNKQGNKEGTGQDRKDIQATIGCILQEEGFISLPHHRHPTYASQLEHLTATGRGGYEHLPAAHSYILRNIHSPDALERRLRDLDLGLIPSERKRFL